MESPATDVVPTVDLSSFTTDSHFAARKAAAQELARCCRPHGCVGIIGHGVPHELLVEAFEVAETLFDLPMEDKMKAPHPQARIPHRGYSAPGREKAFSRDDILTNSEAMARAKRRIRDIHETYECGDESNSVQTNIWLPEDVLPGFRDFSMKLFWRLHHCSRSILETLMMSLDLTEEECNYLRKLHPGYSEQLRYAHYPSVSTESLDREELNRLPAHTDWSSFTLLFQDDAGGLEFRNAQSGAFMLAIPAVDKLYLNIGDMFMRITNGMYPSATHRVAVPQSAMAKGAEVTRARYSIPFFFSPHADMMATPLQTCVTDDHPVKFKPIKISDYSAEMSKWQYEKSESKNE